MKAVFWSDEAIVSIQNIYDYIVKDSPQNADLVVTTLFDIGGKLTIFPEKNPKEPVYNTNSKYRLVSLSVRAQSRTNSTSRLRSM
jgi:plasmid stabilization system protein ParE